MSSVGDYTPPHAEPTTAGSPAAESAASPKRSRRRLLVVGLIAVVLIGGIAGAGYAFLGHPRSCAPDDFPSYPGETIKSAQSGVFFSSTGCTMTIDVPAPFDKVEMFYNLRLQMQPYELNGDFDQTSDTFTFDRALDQAGQAHGYMTLTANGQSTTVNVEIDSP